MATGKSKPIMGPGNKPLSAADRVKYGKVDKATVAKLRADNPTLAKAYDKKFGTKPAAAPKAAAKPANRGK